MHLNVPYVKQSKKSFWCGAASATMILKWYGVKISQEQIVKELPITKTGVTVNRLGQFFLRKGFDATVQFWLQGLEPHNRGLEGSAENHSLIRALQKGARQQRHFRTKILCKEMLTFVKCGGNVCLNPPLMRDIENSLRQKQPVILNVDASFLRSKFRVQHGHYIVIKGVNNPWNSDSQVTHPILTIHDPSGNPDMFYYFDEVFYSCHVWYGCALFVKLRK